MSTSLLPFQQSESAHRKQRVFAEKPPTISIEKRDEKGSEKWKAFPTGESGARSRTLPSACQQLWKTN
jgi:hypothetical protein